MRNCVSNVSDRHCATGKCRRVPLPRHPPYGGPVTMHVRHTLKLDRRYPEYPSAARPNRGKKSPFGFSPAAAPRGPRPRPQAPGPRPPTSMGIWGVGMCVLLCIPRRRRLAVMVRRWAAHPGMGWQLPERRLCTTSTYILRAVMPRNLDCFVCVALCIA